MLTQDNWDDYGYKTTFHVVLHISADESLDVSPSYPRRAHLGLIEANAMLRAGLETGYWMGLAHRAITPLPSRHHLGPLLAMCPSTSPQCDATFDQELTDLLPDLHPAEGRVLS